MLRKIFDPANAVTVFVLALLGMYLLIPLYAYYFDNSDSYNLDLAIQCFIACAMIVIGSAIPALDGIVSDQQRKLPINQLLISNTISILFLIFVIITFSTADSIPIFSYFTGASVNELSEQRGELFKGREGWQTILLYLFTFFSMFAMPYAICTHAYLKSRWIFISLPLFFFFTVSFLQKFLFVNALIPLIFAYLFSGRGERRSANYIVLSIPVFLYGLTLLSMGSEAAQSGGFSVGSKFTADYQPSGSVDMLFWRAFAVPVFTATDTLHVFYERLGGIHLNGATSSLIALLIGADRVNLERIVFEYQWGWNETANSNAVFFVDAFVNFGWLGLCLISLVVGQSLRWFRLCRDISLHALWPIYGLSLFTATFIGLLFSNGFLLVWFLLIFTTPKAITSSRPRP